MTYLCVIAKVLYWKHLGNSDSFGKIVIQRRCVYLINFSTGKHRKFMKKIVKQIGGNFWWSHSKQKKCTITFAVSAQFHFWFVGSNININHSTFRHVFCKLFLTPSFGFSIWQPCYINFSWFVRILVKPLGLFIFGFFGNWLSWKKKNEVFYSFLQESQRNQTSCTGKYL